MQDPRIRIASAAVLSLAAFISLHGAAAVFVWWLVHLSGQRIVLNCFQYEGTDAGERSARNLIATEKDIVGGRYAQRSC